MCYIFASGRQNTVRKIYRAPRFIRQVTRYPVTFPRRPFPPSVVLPPNSIFIISYFWVTFPSWRFRIIPYMKDLYAFSIKFLLKNLHCEPIRFKQLMKMKISFKNIHLYAILLISWHFIFAVAPCLAINRYIFTSVKYCYLLEPQ